MTNRFSGSLKGVTMNNAFREKIVGEFVSDNGEIKVLEVYKQYTTQPNMIFFVRRVFLRSHQQYCFVGENILHSFSFKNEEQYNQFVEKLNQSDDLFGFQAA
ncbi:MAG: hypothetical protein IJ143_03475 [Neisseriaceae bacterium]|nr:hypothetical protein [Neisseriaceae bacterium]